MRQHLHWKAKAEFPYILNLDAGFTPYTQTAPPLQFKKFNFLGGEPHFQITTSCYAETAPLIITQRYNTVGDLFDGFLFMDSSP